MTSSDRRQSIRDAWNNKRLRAAAFGDADASGYPGDDLEKRFLREEKSCLIGGFGASPATTASTASTAISEAATGLEYHRLPWAKIAVFLDDCAVGRLSIALVSRHLFDFKAPEVWQELCSIMSPVLDPNWAFRQLTANGNPSKTYRRQRTLLAKFNVILHQSVIFLTPLLRHLGGHRCAREIFPSFPSSRHDAAVMRSYSALGVPGSQAASSESAGYNHAKLVSLLITKESNTHLHRMYRGVKRATPMWLCLALIFGVVRPIHRETCHMMFFAHSVSCVRWTQGKDLRSCCFAPRLFEGLVMAAVPPEVMPPSMRRDVVNNGGVCVDNPEHPSVTHVVSEEMVFPMPAVPVVSPDWVRTSIMACDLMHERCFVPGRGGMR
eukprot:GEMP01059713.1.p1 GENE.GEMP01059713.1~~GEMP01059713.1.p1  ORF type:complete len:381 (+),score=66.18 GEMP01059713.1:133-1275(+)